MKKLFLFAFILGATTLTSCKEEGCTDPDATNYNSDANKDDDSCIYPDEDDEPLNINSTLYYDVMVDGVHQREEASAWGGVIPLTGGSSGTDNIYSYRASFENFSTSRVGMEVGYYFYHDYNSFDTVAYPSLTHLGVGQKQLATETDFFDKFYIGLEDENGTFFASDNTTQNGAVIEVLESFDFIQAGTFGVMVKYSFNNVKVAPYGEPNNTKTLTDGVFIGVYHPVW